jgi:uncharacterized membrane protein (UPF0127 family)
MRYLVLIIILGILGGAILIYKIGFLKNEYKKATVVIKNNNFEVEIADDPLKMAKGLSGRKEIKPDEGMLFLFRSSSMRMFWMKGMLMPIDILWIDKGRVIGIEKNVPPEPGVSFGQLKRYRSSEPSECVLEIAAGRAEELDIQVGDDVNIRFE